MRTLESLTLSMIGSTTSGYLPGLGTKSGWSPRSKVIASQVLRKVIGSFSNDITEDMLLVNTAKGIEVSTGMRLSEVMKDEICLLYSSLQILQDY